ncbi:hypothetical protein [Brachybacterium saurashtrense]|uniref:Peptidoglycan-binding protein n=1 Tax=Brachybacterium saurashtrense TaxID=556288 RepID=A0A345YN04_9MICO|nr:hypothetical protein [Brachybacterium saurashtrense]AXK45306.1 hypothetical protein DWV08_06530 [Brachybacterium saurashtrense]RRR21937.1 hypothetical protein DXU92_11540 [Brachybacterium saurashtrense]
MTEPETTPRRGRRARALSAEESAALEARASVEASGEQPAVPGVRGAVAPPTAEAPVPTLRKFGRRARIIELSEEPAPEVARTAEPAPEAPVAEDGAATATHDHDGVELGELPVTEAPEPRPAPRFEGQVLHRPENTGGRALVWVVWVLIALALVALIALLLTGVLGPGVASSADALSPLPGIALDHPLLEDAAA